MMSLSSGTGRWVLEIDQVEFDNWNNRRDPGNWWLLPGLSMHSASCTRRYSGTKSKTIPPTI